MPLFRLSDELIFPPAWLARSDGLLCVGGDLSPARLKLAYEQGIFPWFSEHDPLLWWSPDPRLVLIPDQIHISKSLKKSLRRQPVQIRINSDFEQTIRACAEPRKTETETWLLEEMIEAYILAHETGFAHSIETWRSNQMIGGLYGISLGGTFFGESMFAVEDNASKMALVGLTAHLARHGFDIIDCQVTTRHLTSMGAREISRNDFLKIINPSVKRPMPDTLWKKGQTILLNSNPGTE